MDESPSIVQSFIIKLWLIGDEREAGVWRGYITHVPDGERRYFSRLSEIDDFFRRYRIEMRPRRRLASRFVDWLRQ
jgi:hypothetical protein